MIGGIGATVQHYRCVRRAPGWLASQASGLIGLIAGALLLGGFLATRATEPIIAMAQMTAPRIVAPGIAWASPMSDVTRYV